MIKRQLTALLATATFAAAITTTACKKEEAAKETAPAPASQPAVPTAQAAVAEYGFEDGNGKWAPNGSGVKVEQSSTVKRNGNASLKISGTSAAGKWNFVFSPKFPLQSGKKYKLTAAMMVEALKTPTFPPLLKCGIYKDNQWIANAFSKRYDVKKGGWQDITVTFDAPADATQGFIAVEKGTDKAVEATVYLDDIKLEAL